MLDILSDVFQLESRYFTSNVADGYRLIEKGIYHFSLLLVFFSKVDHSFLAVYSWHMQEMETSTYVFFLIKITKRK